MKKIMKIGRKKIGDGSPTYVIAEAGINHNGDIEIAKEMIESAQRSGADAIKFQTFFPDELFSEVLNPELCKMAKQWSFTTLKENIQLKKFSEKCGIEFLSTPLGKKSSGLLKKVEVKAFKIASMDLTNNELIEFLAKFKLPLIISTGMSSISEIEEASQIPVQLKCPFALLHCVSSYPTDLKDANLMTIPFLSKMFNVPIGYSDHTIGNEACLSAVSLGANIIEKHFTLDKQMEGPDQKLSADVKQFKNMISQIRKIEKSLGVRRSVPFSSEQKPRKMMRRSLGASRNIPVGTKISRSMITLIRPGSGISTTMLENILGKITKKNIKKGTLLNWNSF
jgi:N,N'-diacetyllegionaminate synthase